MSSPRIRKQVYELTVEDLDRWAPVDCAGRLLPVLPEINYTTTEECRRDRRLPESNVAVDVSGGLSPFVPAIKNSTIEAPPFRVLPHTRL